LRRMWILMESDTPNREGFEAFLLQERSRETLKGVPEGEGLLLLLAGYNRMAGYDFPGAGRSLSNRLPRT
jgi:hypothetical protein